MFIIGFLLMMFGIVAAYVAPDSGFDLMFVMLGGMVTGIAGGSENRL